MGKKSKKSKSISKEEKKLEKKEEKKIEKNEVKSPKIDKKEKHGKSIKKKESGYEVELDPHAQHPTEEEIKRFGPLSLEARQAHTAIVLLDSEEDHVLIESLNSLQRFCSKRLENRELFILFKGITGIWKYFHHPHLIIQRLALKILAIVSEVHKTKLICRDRDIGKELVTLMESEDDVIAEYASVVAMNLVTIFAGRLQIIQNDGIPILLSRMEHSDPDIQKNSIAAIYNLLEEPLHHDFFTPAENLARIYKLLESPFPQIQINTLAVLERLSRRASGVKAIQNTDLFDKIRQKLEEKEFGDLHRACLRILLNLVQDVTNCQKLTGSLNELTDLLDQSKDLQVLILIVNILGKMARIPSITKSLVKNDMISRLISIVATQANPDIREAAIYAAAQIGATHYKAKRLLVEMFKPLRSFFHDHRAKAQSFEYIFLALSVILEDGEEAVREFLEQGGLFMLLRACSESSNEKYTINSRISALTCIKTIGAYHMFRKKMITARLFPAVLNLMAFPDAQVVSFAANALCCLVGEEEARDQFISKQGSNYIISAAQNPELNVVIAIIPLINAIASYPEVAADLINHGILAIIWGRRDLLSRNGGPLRVTMNRLISNHLPAKYAYMGHIGPYEKLPHGFYDAGYLNTEDAFVPLEDISFQDRDKHPKVIYLNIDHVAHPALFQNNPVMAAIENENIPSILDFAAQVRSLIPDNVRSEKDLVGLIATIVCGNLGGPVDKWRVSAHTEELALADLQSKHQSVAVPLTMMTNGAHRPRALMFKALADIFGVPCSLDRGGFKKCWNVVLIRAKKMHTCCPCPEKPGDEEMTFFTERLRRFVVDLLYAPGSLFPLYSYEADTYCFC